MPESEKLRERQKRLLQTLKRIGLTADFWLLGLVFPLVTVSLILDWPRPGERAAERVDQFSFVVIGIVLPLLWVTGRRAKRWERYLIGSVITIPIATAVLVPFLYVVTIQVLGNSYGGLPDELRHFDGRFPPEGIKVKLLKDDWSEVKPDDRYEVLLQNLEKADGPDILELDGIWMEGLIKSGKLLPLDKFYERDMGDQRFLVAALDVARDSKTGKLFGIPLYLDVGLIFYRKDLLGELPDPTTLDDLKKSISQLFARSKKKGLLGFIFQSAQFEGLNAFFFEALSSEKVNIVRNDGKVHINSNAAKSVLKKLHQSIYEHGMVSAAVLVFQEEESRKLFMIGRAAVLRNWPYVLHQWDSSWIPKETVGITTFRNPVLGGWFLSIAKESKHPEKAWKVIQYLISIQRLRATHPDRSRRRIPSDTEVLSGLHIDFPFMSKVEKALAIAKARPRIENYDLFSKNLSNVLFNILNDANATGETIGIALDEVQKELDR